MIQVCTLCEASTMHEGLLNILGAGITRIARPGFPAPLGLTLVILDVLSFEETRRQQRLEVEVEWLLEGESQGVMRVGGIPDPNIVLDPIAPVVAPLAFQLPFPLIGPGSYTVRVSTATQTVDLPLRVDMLELEIVNVSPRPTKAPKSAKVAKRPKPGVKAPSRRG